MKKKSFNRKEPEKKKEKIHICRECGKAIMAGDPYEHIVTKRKTESWLHRECISTGAKEGK